MSCTTCEYWNVFKNTMFYIKKIQKKLVDYFMAYKCSVTYHKAFKWLYIIPFIWQPILDLLAFRGSLSSSIDTLNKIGDKMPPLHAPFKTWDKLREGMSPPNPELLITMPVT